MLTSSQESNNFHKTPQRPKSDFFRRQSLNLSNQQRWDKASEFFQLDEIVKNDHSNENEPFELSELAHLSLNELSQLNQSDENLAAIYSPEQSRVIEIGQDELYNLENSDEDYLSNDGQLSHNFDSKHVLHNNYSLMSELNSQINHSNQHEVTGLDEADMSKLDQVLYDNDEKSAFSNDQSGWLKRVASSPTQRSQVYEKSSATSKSFSSIQEENEHLKHLLQEMLYKHEELERMLGQSEVVRKRDSDQLVALHQTELDELKLEHKHELESSQATIKRIQDQNSSHMMRIKDLETELTTARNGQAHLSAIRSTLENEKNLDILNLRKELLHQKERELHDIKQDIAKEKEELKASHSQDLTRIEREFENDKSKLIEKIAQLSQISQKESVSIGAQTHSDCLIFGDDFDRLLSLFNLSVTSPQELIEYIQTHIANHKALAVKVDTLNHQLKTLKDSHSQQLIEAKLSCSPKHKNTIRSLSETHNNQLNELRQRIQELEQENTKHEISRHREITATELESMYPSQIKQIEKRIESNFDSRLKLTQRSQRLEMEALVNDLNAEKEIIRQKCHQDVENISANLKHQCSMAYESAMSRVKSEYAKSLQNEKETFQIREETYKQTITSLSGQLDSLRKASVYQGSQSDQERKISDLKRDMAQMQRTHEIQLIEKDTSYKRMMDGMKSRYLGTLKSMRDEIVASKKRSLERLEVEWSRRKKLLEDEWRRKYVKKNDSYFRYRS